MFKSIESFAGGHGWHVHWARATIQTVVSWRMEKRACRNRWFLQLSHERSYSRDWKALSLIHCLATWTAEPHIRWCTVLASQTHSRRRIEYMTVSWSINALSIKQILSGFAFLDKDTLTIDYLVIATNTEDTKTNRIYFQTVCRYLNTLSLDNHFIASTIVHLSNTLPCKIFWKSFNALNTVRIN